MHWIYILKCENNYLYVGETTRLYRRFWEHGSGRGGINTSIYPPENIIGIYKSHRIGNFIRYDNLVNSNELKSSYGFLREFNDYEDRQNDKLEIENHITECLMINNPNNFKNIRGGKYTRFDCDYNLPNYESNIPLCKCNIPCDINKNEKKGYLYFRCAKKNMWDSFREDFDIEDEPCNYYEEYLNDISIRNSEKKKNKSYNFDKEMKDKINNDYLIDSDDD